MLILTLGETSLTLGAAVQVSSPNEDDTQWKIEQTEVGKNLYIPYGVAELDWALGPTRVSQLTVHEFKQELIYLLSRSRDMLIQAH